MHIGDSIYLGLSDEGRVCLPLSMANRHGLISGATGTGKTVTMKVMAESFSDAGVPVFVCDIKGDVSGLIEPGEQNEGMEKRIDKFGIRDCFTYRPYPVCFWDVYGEKGHPVRATVSEIGPELLSLILDLTDAQSGILNIVFKIADDNGLLLDDLKDLRAMLNYVVEHKKEYAMTYGNITTVSASAVIRSLIPLETQGGNLFFGKPDLDLRDWMRTDGQGHGIINVLDCVRLWQNPTLYATFLLWMLSELYETLPEAGDLDKPKLVFFFDEAHTLFTDAPRALVKKVEQVVKLIRSKGVGVFFVTQAPSDIPNSVLAQLSNRVQHALRAYTPSEQKAVRTAAQTMRANPAFDTEKVIMELGVGKALISVLDEDGVPGVTQNCSVLCPQSLMAAAREETRARVMAEDGMNKYDAPEDPDSAYESLEEKTAEEKAEKERAEAEAAAAKERAAKEKAEAKAKAASSRKKKSAAERAASRIRNHFERNLTNEAYKFIKRGILSILKR